MRVDGSLQAVHEERPIGELRQRIVEGLPRELIEPARKLVDLIGLMLDGGEHLGEVLDEAPISSRRLVTAGKSDAFATPARCAAREMALAMSQMTKPPPAIRSAVNSKRAGTVTASVRSPTVSQLRTESGRRTSTAGAE